MNILYLAHRFPYPPNKGDKLRAYRQIEYLARRHRIYCACFVDDPADLAHVDRLRAHCAELRVVRIRPLPALIRGVIGLLRGKTLTESFYRVRAMSEAIAELGREVKFDAVLAFSSSMAPYALEAEAPRRVLDLCDLDSSKWCDYAKRSRGPMRWLYALEGKRLASRECRWLEEFEATVLITEAEAEDLRSANENEKVHVVGNGVVVPEDPGASDGISRAADEVGATLGFFRVADTVGATDGISRAAGFSLREPATESNRPPTATSRRLKPAAQDRSVRSLLVGKTADAEGVGGPVVGFVGQMDYAPNVDAVCWFARTAWPRIREVFPTARFRIVGRSPARRVRRLAQIRGVEVVGPVDDVTVEVAHFDVSVAPLRIARGLQNKVLEAMASAKPVVLTAQAAAGIQAKHETHFLVAHSAPELASLVVGLLADEDRRRQIGQAARAYVQRHHQWDRELATLELLVSGQTVPRSAPSASPSRGADRVEPIEREHLPAAGH